MITVICGEDVSSSRDYYFGLKKQFKIKGYEVAEIRVSDVEKINQWLGDSPTLFNQQKVFFAEGLNKFFGKNNKNLTLELEKIRENKNIELIIWEKVSAWELKLKKLGIVKEFKPDQSIFKLVDSLYPGNRTDFIAQLKTLNETQDENFIFIMLLRTVRNLLIVKSGVNPVKMQSWQTAKLRYQAAYWKMENLLNFYDALFKIEVAQKTGSSPYNIKESLDILACHFL